MLWLPNLPHESVPVAASEDDNRPSPPQGDFREFDVPPLPHWELAPALGILDLERGVKLAGSRGYVLKGAGAHLQQALINFFLDQARGNGYEQVYVPLLVPAQMLEGSAQLPKFADTVYQDADAGLYMLPTAEVALTNLHRDEILDESDLPLKYVAHSPCFRREHMSAGRDTRGIKRVHQFEKVEQYLFTTPEQSYAALESLTEAAEDLCRALQLPFAASKSSLATWASAPARSTTSRSIRPAATNGSRSAPAATPRPSRRGAPTSASAAKA